MWNFCRTDRDRKFKNPPPSPPHKHTPGAAKSMQQILATFRQNSTQAHCTKVPKQYLHGRRMVVKIEFCFVDRASRYIRVMKTKLMHYLS
jgi:hypothetical protein